MGLNEVYTVIRGNFFMMSPLFAMAQAFSILVQEEKQREVRPHNRLHLESTSLNANSGSNTGYRNSNTGSSTNFRRSNAGNDTNNFKTNYAPPRNWGKNVYRSGHTNNPSSSHSENSFNNNKALLFCDYYKKTGHTEDRCYRLHGFPQDFKFTKGRNLSAATNVLENIEGMSSGNLEGSNIRLDHNLTRDQYNQLTRILGNIHVKGHDTGGEIRNHADNLTSGYGAMNIAGPFTKEPSGD